MHPEKLQAFVLSSLDYGESDRIATLFTLEHGRLKVFARAARASRKRFGPALESCARIEAQARIGEGLCSLQQAEIVTLYPALRADLTRIAHGLYACELIEALTPEGHPLPRLFRLLTACLERLESVGADEAERRFFEINLLNILGYRPSLERCSRCGTCFEERGALMHGTGEPLCRSCAATGRPVCPNALLALSSCLATGTFGRVIFSREALADAGYLLDETLAAHAGRKLKSLDFLRQVTAAD